MVLLTMGGNQLSVLLNKKTVAHREICEASARESNMYLSSNLIPKYQHIFIFMAVCYEFGRTELAPQDER